MMHINSNGNDTANNNNNANSNMQMNMNMNAKKRALNFEVSYGNTGGGVFKVEMQKYVQLFFWLVITFLNIYKKI